ncbi:MAG TPA: ABC transporter permease subunit [Candidatus Limnocylindria bacterium]|nr:ABC transporter permease subunit [Candidatus Limnocylindria bacterium]
MSPALVVARLVVREVLRRRLVLALLALTLVAIVLTAWGFSRIPTLTTRGVPIGDVQVKAISAFLLILVMFMFSNVLALSAVFIAAPSISGDVESGIAQAVLSRPLPRAAFVIGKWLGLALLVAAYAVLAALIELLVVNAVVGYAPPRPLELLLFLFAEGLVLLTLGTLLSTRLSGMVGGVIALVLFGMAWLGGIVGGIGSAFENDVVEGVGIATKLVLPTDALWRGAVWALQPEALRAGGAAFGPAAAANPFYQPSAPPAAYLVWCGLWTAGMLALAVWSFDRREV